jgi:hypothetical protein
MRSCGHAKPRHCLLRELAVGKQLLRRRSGHDRLLLLAADDGQDYLPKEY